MQQLKIGGYVRVSTEEQASLVDGSLDNQKYRINAFVDLKNVQEPQWGKVVDFYIDDGYSAKDTRRPAFQRMMSDLKRGKINHILVADLSRLSRSISDFCGILEVLKVHEASFLSIKEQFDTSTPAGKMMLYNMINLAQFEREQTAERVALGCHSRAMRGLLNGGHEILGYSKVPERKNTYVVNEDEVEMIRTIFQKFLELGSLNRTIAVLEELGIGPKIKKNRKERLIERGLWTHQTLGSLLRSPAYIGLREVNRKNKDTESRLLKSHQKYQLVKATWSGIVDKDVFEAVQVLLDENKLKERRRLSGSEKRVFLASGIVRCAECGRVLVGQSAHGQMSVHRYYVHGYSKGDVVTCSVKRIRAEEIEDALSKHVSKILQDGRYLDSVAGKIATQAKEKESSAKGERKRLQKELQEVEKEMEAAFKFQMKAEQESESAKFFYEKIEVLGKRKISLEKNISETSDPESNVISLSEVRRDLEGRVQAVSKGWTKLSAIQQKRALRRLVQQLLIGPKGIDIYYYSSALSDGMSSGGLFREQKSPAKVIPFRALGIEKADSKLKVQNCLSARLVMPLRFERRTYALEGRCSIQLSYGTRVT